MSVQRCFIGIHLEDLPNYSLIIEEIKKELEIKLSITNPSKYHMTLHFFGDLDEQQIKKVGDILKEIEFESFQVKLGKSDILPANIRKARVLTISPLSGTNQINHLANKIRNKLAENNYIIDSRGFKPHLTVTRIRYGKDRQILAQRWLDQNIVESDQITIEKFLLIASTLTPQGSIYKEIKSFPSKNQVISKG